MLISLWINVISFWHLHWYHRHSFDSFKTTIYYNYTNQPYRVKCSCGKTIYRKEHF